MRTINIFFAIIGAAIGVAAIGYAALIATTEVAWVMVLIGVAAAVVGWVAHRRVFLWAAIIGGALWAVGTAQAQNVSDFGKGMVQFTNVLIDWSSQSPALRDVTVQTGNAHLDQFIQAGRAFDGKVIPVPKGYGPVVGHFEVINDGVTGAATYHLGVITPLNGSVLVMASVCRAKVEESFDLQTDGAGRTTGNTQRQVGNVSCGDGYAAVHQGSVTAVGNLQHAFVNGGGRDGVFDLPATTNNAESMAYYTLAQQIKHWAKVVPGQLPRKVPACLSQGGCR